MKHSVYHYLLAFLIIGASFQVSVSAMTLNFIEKNIIQNNVTRWVNKQPSSMLNSRIGQVLTRIDDLQSRARFTERAYAIVAYLEEILREIYQIVQTPVTPPPVTTPISSILPTKLSVPSRIDTNYLVIEGENSPLLRKIEFSVNIEPILIQEIDLHATHLQISEYVSEIGLYDEDGNLLSTISPTDTEISRDGIDKLYQPGSHEFYLAIRTSDRASIDDDEAIKLGFTLMQMQGEGRYTRKNINITQTNTSPEITITPIGIATVDLIDDRNGHTADTFLSNGENILGILEIGATASHHHSIKELELETLTINVQDDTIANDVDEHIWISRLDVASSKIYGSSLGGEQVRFDLGDLTIHDGETAIFQIGASPTLEGSTRERVQISIPGLKTGALRYHPVHTTTSIDTISQSEREVFGPIVSE